MAKLAYVDAFVLNAPADLPDGVYAVIFDRHKMQATKHHNL
jgi:hypothetical protein